MSAKKDNLFTLIQSLTPGEKRYFKSFVQGGSNQQDTKYIHLFDTLSRLKEYDESALLKDPMFDNKPNRLAVAKNYLYQLILKSLRNNGTHKTPEFFILEMLLDLESLYNRRMFDQAMKIAEKAKRMAEEYFYYDLLITIAHWERRLIEHSDDANKYNEMYEKVLEWENFAAHQLRLNRLYFKQYKKLNFSNQHHGYFKKGDNMEAFIGYLQYPELENYKLATNPVAKVYFNLCYHEYYLSIRHHSNRYEVSKQLINLFHEHPTLVKRIPLAYLKSVVSLLICQLNLGMIAEFDENIQHFNQLIFPRYEHSLHRYKNIEFLHLSLVRDYAMGDFERGVSEKAPLIEAYYEANGLDMIHSKAFS